MNFQITAILISVGALFVSWLSYRNSQKVGKAQTLVAEETYKRMKREEEEREKPEIGFFESTKVGQFGSSPILEIRNVGRKSINNFSVVITSNDSGDKNYASHNYKFPLEAFEKGSSLKFLILVPQGGRRTLRFICTGNEFTDFYESTFF